MAYINGNEILFSSNISLDGTNAEVQERLTALEETTVELETNKAEKAAVNSLQRDIEVLKAAAEGNIYSFETDSAVAYAKAVPTNALPYASLDKVGGMIGKITRQENILPNGYVSLSDGGSSGGSVTYNEADNSFTFDGYFDNASATVIIDHNTAFALAAGTYTFELSGANGAPCYAFVEAKKNGEVVYSSTIYETTQMFELQDGADSICLEINDLGAVGFENASITPLLIGEVVELVNAPVTSVKVQGKNLVPFTTLLLNKVEKGITFKGLGDGGIHVYGTSEEGAYPSYYFARSLTLPIGNYVLYMQILDGARSFVVKKTDKNGAVSYPTNTFEAVEGDKFDLYLQVYPNKTVDYVIYPQIEAGTTATAFSLYTETTYPIPEAVQQLDGYGLGISEALHNYIDFESKTFVRMVAERAYQEGDTNSDTMLTNGVKTIYALDAVETVDISAVLTGDNIITVEGNGFITAENESATATPFSVTYQVKL